MNIPVRLALGITTPLCPLLSPLAEETVITLLLSFYHNNHLGAFSSHSFFIIRQKRKKKHTQTHLIKPLG